MAAAAAKARLLVLNAGSSSVKYKLFQVSKQNGVEAAVFSGLAELSMVKGTQGRITHKDHHNDSKQQVELELPSHRSALEQLVKRFFGEELDFIRAIGHRVTHGGEEFSKPTVIDDRLVEQVDKLCHLAPLHNPANLSGIKVAQQVFGRATPNVAVFDTSFHLTLPAKSFMYALPYCLYEQHGIRRYGFHGTSHQYVAHKAATLLGKPFDQCNFITFHLGNGSSMCAIRDGKSVDTTMGLTPLDGLIMGTRSGDIDPGLYAFLNKELGMSIDDTYQMLNKKSGLLGISGDADIRHLQDRVIENGDKRADLALNMFAHRARKYLGSYLVSLHGKVDALIFTGGIGENSGMLRERICADLEALGIELDKEKNMQVTYPTKIEQVHSAKSDHKVLVIPTDEERSIADQTFDLVLRD